MERCTAAPGAMPANGPLESVLAVSVPWASTHTLCAARAEDRLSAAAAQRRMLFMEESVYRELAALPLVSPSASERQGDERAEQAAEPWGSTSPRAEVPGSDRPTGLRATWARSAGSSPPRAP